MSEVIIYQDLDAANPVHGTLESEPVWLTQAQMAELPLVRPEYIATHLKISSDSELEEATCKDVLQVQARKSQPPNTC